MCLQQPGPDAITEGRFLFCSFIREWPVSAVAAGPGPLAMEHWPGGHTGRPRRLLEESARGEVVKWSPREAAIGGARPPAEEQETKWARSLHFDRCADPQSRYNSAQQGNCHCAARQDMREGLHGNSGHPRQRSGLRISVYRCALGELNSMRRTWGSHLTFRGRVATCAQSNDRLHHAQRIEAGRPSNSMKNPIRALSSGRYVGEVTLQERPQRKLWWPSANVQADTSLFACR